MIPLIFNVESFGTDTVTSFAIIPLGSTTHLSNTSHCFLLLLASLITALLSLVVPFSINLIVTIVISSSFSTSSTLTFSSSISSSFSKASFKSFLETNLLSSSFNVS